MPKQLKSSVKKTSSEKNNLTGNGFSFSDQEWEALCKQCGLCCFEKWVDDDGTIRPTSIPCRYLDVVTRRCKVYHKRFKVGEGCVKLTPDVVEIVQWLPPDCAYVQLIRRKNDK